MITKVIIYRIIVYVLLTVFAVSILVPVAWVFIASIKENSDFYKSPWAFPTGFHIENYISAWKRANVGSYFLNSTVVTIAALVILLLISLPASYVMSRYDFTGISVARTLFMSGLFINVSYIVVPIFLMLIDAGDFIGSQIFLNNRFILALVYASTALPFTIYLLSGYMKTIPRAYEEAAMVDGCGHFRTMISVVLPMVKPGIVTVILFNFLSFWNEYIIALTLMTGDNAKTLPVGLMNLMKAQNASAEYGPMYAGLVIVMIPTLIMYIIVQKKLLSGISVGGIKG